MKLAEYGIIYIDEIDKIAASGNVHGPDVSRTGVQRALLKLMEDTEVDMRVPHDIASQMEAMMETQKSGKAERKKVSTKNILFIVSGAFSGLGEIVRRRLAKGTMGFKDMAEIVTKDEELIKRSNTQDLMEYGFESEFVGRLPVVAQLRELDEKALFDILKSPHSAVIQGKTRDFAAYGIALEFEDDALKEIAHRAHKEGIGARGLLSVVEKALVKFEKLLPDSTVKKLVVTKELVTNPQEALCNLLTDDTISTFQRKFLEKTGLVLEIPADSKQWIKKNLPLDPQKLVEKFQEMFKNYEYGMKLAGLQSLKVTSKVLENPDIYLDKLIKKAYEDKEK